MTTHSYIACDLGAESGRVILGTLSGGKLSLEEVHRFPNGPIQRRTATCTGTSTGLRRRLKPGWRRSQSACEHDGTARRKRQCGLLGRGLCAGRRRLQAAGAALIITGPAHRPCLRGRPADRLPRHIFAETGIQFMPINTLYQMLAHHSPTRRRWPGRSIPADCRLLRGAFFRRRPGRAQLASTTQLYNPQRKSGRKRSLTGFGLPRSLFPRTCRLRHRAGIADCPDRRARPACRRSPGGRDLLPRYGAASPPCRKKATTGRIFHSGTWSLLGVELPAR